MTPPLVDVIYPILADYYPPDQAFLTHRNAYELLIAVILSAQCTDDRVNQVTPALFDAYPTPEALAEASLDAIKDKIRSINFFNNKAKNIQATARSLLANFGGNVPDTLDAMVQLPGVGRKTANVVLSQWFKQPGIAVDTHVARVSRRLGFHGDTDPVRIEHRLKADWPESLWSHLSTLLIFHGRTFCLSRKPLCQTCILAAHCPSESVC